MSCRFYSSKSLKTLSEVPSFCAATEAYIAGTMHEVYSAWNREKGAIVKETNVNGDNWLHVFDIEKFPKIFESQSFDKHHLKGKRHIIRDFRRSNIIKFPPLGECVHWSNLSDFLQNGYMYNSTFHYDIEWHLGELVYYLLYRSDCAAVDILQYLRLWMYETMGRYLFQENLNSFSDLETQEASDMIEALLKSSDIMYRSVYNVSRPSDLEELSISQNFLYSIVNRLVKEATENPEGTSYAKSLHLMGISTEKITTAFIDILQESIEPVSLMLTWALYHLARSPEVQDIFRRKIQKRDRSFNGQQLDTTQYIFHPEILEYYSKILLETIRLNYPTIGMKRILTSPQIICGYLIPSNTLVLTHNQLVGRMAEYFDDPLTFNPERNLYFSWFSCLPFGIGTICGGSKLAKGMMYMALVKMVNNFEISYQYEDVSSINKLYNQPSQKILLTLKEVKF